MHENRMTLAPPSMPIWKPGRRGGYVDRSLDDEWADIFSGFVPYALMMGVVMAVALVFERRKQQVQLERKGLAPAEERRALRLFFGNKSEQDSSDEKEVDAFVKRKFEELEVHNLVDNRRSYQMVPVPTEVHK
eukprot:TRINITY_DN3770_c0_g1_i1.p4 TRINITY_DN3770_c0_g1~~TRINITY_DN3770_c0_g1_i1.p4  ORF type:complete len:133 (-),score=45.46 TRINITY_DN3770_c0_g1_i1:484-882(-)